MGYNDSDPVAQKTGRIALLCGTMIILGFFLFLFKTESCTHTPGICQEEFIEIRTDGVHNAHQCSPGAIVDVVNSPPAPKAGIMCHCPKSSEPSPAASAPPVASK